MTCFITPALVLRDAATPLLRMRASFASSHDNSPHPEEPAKLASRRTRAGGITLALLLAACGNATDMPVAAPGEDIVANDMEGVAAPAATAQRTASALPEGCAYPDALPQQSIPWPHLLGPSVADVSGSIPDSKATFASEAGWNDLSDSFLWPTSHLPVREGMAAEEADRVMGCFFERVGDYARPAGIGWTDADSVLSYRGGGFSPYFDAVQYAVMVKDGEVANVLAAGVCDAEHDGFAIDDFESCAAIPGELDGFAEIYGPNEAYMGEYGRFKLAKGMEDYMVDSAMDRAFALEDPDSVEGPKPMARKETLRADGTKVVTYSQTGYMDDAVSGDRIRVVFAPFAGMEPGETTYHLRHAGQQRMCYRDGSSSWTTKPCP